MSTYKPNNIKLYRERMGLSKKQLAERIGVNESQIGRYESGEQQPGYDKTFAIAKIFGVSIGMLMGYEKEKQEIRKTEDGYRIISLENAQVVRRQYLSAVNDTSITITPDGIKCSSACVRKWESTQFIHIIVDEEQQLLIIRQSQEDDLDSQRWSRVKDGKAYPRKITGRKFAVRLYDIMNWKPGYIHRISGFLGVNEENKDEKMWYFDLTEAEATPMSAKARIKAGVKDEQIDSDTLNVLNNIEEQKKSEKARREQMKAEGKDPGPMELYIYSPDKWGQYTFGIPCKEHDKRPKAGFST